MNSPEAPETTTLIRRRRVHHAWSEASNPHDLMVARAGWATAILILLVAAWLVARSAGWI